MKRTATLMAVILLGVASRGAADAAESKSLKQDQGVNIDELLEDADQGMMIEGSADKAATRESSQIIPEEELSIEKLHSLFQAAFLPSKLSDDGSTLRIEENGVNVFLKIDTEKRIISYFSMWHLKSAFSMDAKLRLVNRLNDDLILVRFCVPKPDILWCDFQLPYENGVYSYQIISVYRTFLKVVNGAAISCDPEDIIGPEEARASEPAEPRPGLGIILGRVTFTFDGYKGRHNPYSRPLTVHIMHKADGEEDSEAEVTRVVADDKGYFAVGNLPPGQRYWVKKVEGHDFIVNIPFTVSASIRGKDDDSQPQTDVLDVGCFALTVNAEGSIGCQLTSPDCTMTKEADNPESSVQFNSLSPLERHAWFLASYPTSGWAGKVGDHQRQIEGKREDAAKKKREKEANEKAALPKPPEAAAVGNAEEKSSTKKEAPNLPEASSSTPKKKTAPAPKPPETSAPSNTRRSPTHVPSLAAGAMIIELRLVQLG